MKLWTWWYSGVYNLLLCGAFWSRPWACASNPSETYYQNTQEDANKKNQPAQIEIFFLYPLALLQWKEERLTQQQLQHHCLRWVILHKLQKRNSFDEDKKSISYCCECTEWRHTCDEHGHGRVRRAHPSSYQGEHRGRLPGKWTSWMFSSSAAPSRLLHLYPPANQKKKKKTAK